MFALFLSLLDFALKNFTKKNPCSLCSLGVKYHFFVVFSSCFLSLLAFCSEKPYQKFSLLASLARTEIIYVASYKWRSIALILIMHVYCF